MSDLVGNPEDRIAARIVVTVDVDKREVTRHIFILHPHDGFESSN